MQAALQKHRAALMVATLGVKRPVRQTGAVERNRVTPQIAAR